MPLSDEERRVLDRLEEQLTGQARERTRQRARTDAWQRLVLSTVAGLAGLVIVLAGVVVDDGAGTVAATGGFVLMVGAIMFSSDILARAASSFVTLACSTPPASAPRRSHR